MILTQDTQSEPAAILASQVLSLQERSQRAALGSDFTGLRLASPISLCVLLYPSGMGVLVTIFHRVK